MKALRAFFDWSVCAPRVLVCVFLRKFQQQWILDHKESNLSATI